METLRNLQKSCRFVMVSPRRTAPQGWCAGAWRIMSFAKTARPPARGAGLTGAVFRVDVLGSVFGSELCLYAAGRDTVSFDHCGKCRLYAEGGQAVGRIKRAITE
jgi:hypothetical protein